MLRAAVEMADYKLEVKIRLWIVAKSRRLFTVNECDATAAK